MAGILQRLAVPVVQAPMAGGPSTPALALAAIEAGGLGFLAGGYRTADALAEELDAVRARSDGPLAVNLFADPGPPADPAAVARYVAALAAERGPLGAPRHDDDALAAKLEVVLDRRPDAVSFAFGCPAAGTLARLRDARIEPWVTVTTPGEAEHAARAGAGALVVQGTEAGGHRGGFDDMRGGRAGSFGLLALLQLVRARVDMALPLIATGAIATPEAVAAALAAGASAVQVGTALLRAPEAGTSAPHRAALAAATAPTALTRAFSGRLARGIVNRFMREHPDAPSAYPEIHHVTAPLRAAAREAGDAGAINLWAGEAYPLAREEPAAAIVERLGSGVR